MNPVILMGLAAGLGIVACFVQAFWSREEPPKEPEWPEGTVHVVKPIKLIRKL